MKTRWLLGLLGVIILSVSLAQSQPPGDILRYDDNLFWTLPAEECDGGNFCEVRISPQGNIYGWDTVHHKLYVSPTNQDRYETYDLSGDGKYLVFVEDFVPFEDQGYVMLFSPPGASVTLTRYDLKTHTLEIMDFPPEYRLAHCNRPLGQRQSRVRFIFPLGLENKLVACTNSPAHRPLIHIIDVNTLTIERTLNINGYFDDTGKPFWLIAGGLDNKIYALVNNPEATIPDLPEIDTKTQEIILVYDVASDAWTYQIKPAEHTFEILATLPSDGSVFFQNYLPEDHEIIQFSAGFRILRRFGLGANIFQGMTLDGKLFFSSGKDYSDITIIDIQDVPLVDEETTPAAP